MTAPRPWFAALVVVSGIGPMATDTYLAALPAMQRSLHTSATVAQLTMTAFIIGVAFGQLLLGPISDSRGRRGMMLASSAAFTLTSLLCAVMSDGWLLVTVRLFEGLAGGCGVAVARACIGDCYQGTDAARRFGTLIAVTLLGPVIAPAIGSAFLAVGDWRTVFAFLTGLGILMTALVWFGVPETLPPERRDAHGLGNLGRRAQYLMRLPAFVSPVAVQCLATAGFFTYIGGSSIVLQDDLGLSQFRYALLFATNAATMSVASIAFRTLVGRVSAVALRRAGLSISTAAAVALALYAALATPSLGPTWVLLALLVGGMGLSIPATTTLAQEAGRRWSGTASALQGGLTFTVGALATPLTGLFGVETVPGMAAIMVVFFLCCVVVLVLTTRRLRTPAVA